jgi:tryptophan synthase alpha chain
MSGALSGGARLERTLERLRAEGRTGIMSHLVLGYPSLEESRRLVEAMARGGADLIEVQIPFSDPTADGPVITHACQKALDGGVRVADAFDFVAQASRRHDIPFLFMCYFNIAFAYHGGPGAGGGVREFVRRAAGCGAAGLIIPDIPPEEAQEGYPGACREEGIHPIHVVSPNASEERLALVRSVASGFLYVTSRTGTTGREMELELELLARFLAAARRITKLPLAVGFSISRRSQVEALAGHAELAVVGTHLIRIHERDGAEGVERELHLLAGR